MEPLQPGAAFDARGIDVSLGGKSVLRAVDLSVARGEALALVGPSGSGKTSLLRVLGAALEPNAGTVTIEGRDPWRLGAGERRALRSRIGFVHQHLGLVPILRASHNVLMGRLGEHGLVGGLRSVFLPKRAALLEVHALLERVGVEDKLFQRTDTLSGGQSQRVAIARALYQRPAVLLCDEPVASVDPARAQAVVELLVEVARERGLALVVSLHDLDLARAHFPRIVGLRAGRVVFDAHTRDVAAARFDELYRLDDAELLSDGA